jgi:cysteine-rich repeat protein
VEGSQLTVGTGDGMGGCPVDAQTYLRVFDKSGALVAADKTTGPGSCSLLLSTTNSALQGLAVGTYYLQVENLTFAPLPFYVIDVNIAPPSCGDGFVQLVGGEQCDDGANLAGDGCSPTCKLEGLHGTEMEPNDTTATANSLAALDGIVASIGTPNDQDYFSFAVTVPGSSVTLTVDDGLGQCPTGFDSKIYLHDAGGVELTSDNDSGPSSCSTIAPTMYPAAASLAVGTYYVKVEDFGNDDTTPFYVLGVKIKTPACGDGILQVVEQCDDSNVMSGDGCSATCGLEGNFTPETEPNDTQLTSNPIGTADGLIGSISPIGDQDYFSFDIVTPGSSVFVQVTDGINGCPNGFDSKLTLFNPSNALVSTVDDGGVAQCSLLSPATTPTAANMAPGKYRVRVEYSGNTAAVASYVVKIKVVPPSCGDGVIQPGSEQCDDGNVAAGDGCGSTCQAEAPNEIEPNSTIATATPQWPGVNNWIGAIYPAGDHDYYTFTLAADTTVTLTTHSVNDAATCPGDTLLHLTSSAGAELLNNDDAVASAGVAPCSSLTKALLAGTYYAWVQRYQDMVTIGAYQLDLTVQ